MNLGSRQTPTIPLPELSPTFAVDNFGGRVGLRRFGTAEIDLEIDFATNSPAALVTKILDKCVVDDEGRLPTGLFRKLSIGKRLQCLLTLAAGKERVPFAFQFKCIGCSAELEVELTLDEIENIQREADFTRVVDVKIGGKPVTLRKPTGDDQEKWAEMVFRDERTAAKAMAGTLATGSSNIRFRARDLDIIEEAMDEADPLVNFQCPTTCGECGAGNEFSVDLCGVALDMLERQQEQLIVMIHKLASRYHWSEKEIFEIPHWRRLEYLELIAAGR